MTNKQRRTPGELPVQLRVERRQQRVRPRSGVWTVADNRPRSQKALVEFPLPGRQPAYHARSA